MNDRDELILVAERDDAHAEKPGRAFIAVKLAQLLNLLVTIRLSRQRDVS